LADFFGLHLAIYTIGLLTLLSALVIQIRMPADRAATPACLSQAALRKQLLQNKQLQLLDVRSPEEYEAGHLPMALNLPLNQLEGALERLDRQKRYVTVCGKGGGRSASAAELLQKAGFEAIWLCGGTLAWFENIKKKA
jgi:rhodanese-related sulfurtransferase